MRILKWLMVCCVLAGMLVGCGASNSSTSTGSATTGVLIDGPLKGVKYVFSNYSGLTGDGGTFSCVSGESGVFKIGNLVIGRANCGAVLTPVDLVRKAKPSLSATEAETEAVKIVQFLMTVGTVNSDGSIDLSASLFSNAAANAASLATVDLLGSSTDLLATAKLLSPTVSTLVNASTASTHLTQSLANRDSAKHAGEYLMYGSGYDTAVYISVKSDGTVSGIATDVSGAVYTFSIPSGIGTDGSFSGKIGQNGLGLGSITGISDGAGKITGTVTLSNTTPAKTIQYSLTRVTTATNPIAGIFKGTFGSSTSGQAAFSIDSAGKVLGWYIISGGSTAYALSGTVDMLTGKVTSGSAVGGVTFTGQLVNGTLSGTWRTSSENGTFSATKLTN